MIPSKDRGRFLFSLSQAGGVKSSAEKYGPEPDLSRVNAFIGILIPSTPAVIYAVSVLLGKIDVGMLVKTISSFTIGALFLAATWAIAGILTKTITSQEPPAQQSSGQGQNNHPGKWRSLAKHLSLDFLSVFMSPETRDAYDILMADVRRISRRKIDEGYSPAFVKVASLTRQICFTIPIFTDWAWRLIACISPLGPIARAVRRSGK